MTFDELKDEVILTLGNLHSSHPMYDSVGTWVNRATNRVVTMAISANKQKPNLFPELTTSWTSITVAGTNYLSEPSDKFAITSLYSFDDDAVPNTSTDRSLPMSFMPMEHFEVITRDDTVEGYPRIWSRKGRKVYIWPTPSADYITYLHMYGIMREPEMSAPDDEPVMSELWHDAIVNVAAAIGAGKLGWSEDAANFMAAATTDIGMAANITALEEMDRNTPVRLAQQITRGDLY